MGNLDIAKKEEGKADDKKDTPVVGDANAKNKKKKEKKKAKAAAEVVEKKDEVVVEQKELTEDERKAAIKAAIQKRNASNKIINQDDKDSLASSIKAEKEKRGVKKEKNYGNSTLY